MKKKPWIIGGVIVALLGTTAIAASAYRSFTPEKRAEHMTEIAAEHLDLDETQRASFEKLALSAAEMRGAGPVFMMGLKGKLKELTDDETLTIEEANQLRDEIKAEFDRRAEILIPDFVTFFNGLSDSQRDMVLARLDEMGKHMGRHDGRHGAKGDRGGKRHHAKRGGWHMDDDGEEGPGKRQRKRDGSHMGEGGEEGPGMRQRKRDGSHMGEGGQGMRRGRQSE